MKVLICGGRDYQDLAKLSEVLGRYEITTLIQGGAKGADSLAQAYADAHGIPALEYVAEWHRYGRRAGPIRNATMLKENPDIDLVIAFPGGPGTANMIEQASRAGLKIIEV